MTRKQYTYLATIPPNTVEPIVIYEFRLRDEARLKELIVNVFDDVDGTAGIKVAIGDRFKIPDEEVGDGWISGDNAVYHIVVDRQIKYNEVIRIIGRNTHDTLEKHFFLLFNIKYDYEPLPEEG